MQAQQCGSGLFAGSSQAPYTRPAKRGVGNCRSATSAYPWSPAVNMAARVTSALPEQIPELVNWYRTNQPLYKCRNCGAEANVGSHLKCPTPGCGYKHPFLWTTIQSSLIDAEYVGHPLVLIITLT